MEKNTARAAFGGLFHDNGKIAQRAQLNPMGKPDGLEKEGQPVHALWTQALADEVSGEFKSAALHSVYHHQPERSPASDKTLSLLIAVADKLSAGERSDEEMEKQKNPPKQMLSVFNRVGAFRADPSKQKDYLPLRQISLKRDALFPGAALAGHPAKEYEALSKPIRETLRNMSGDAETDIERALFTLEKEAWCVPSSYYYNLPDISLYDHARTTAAIAVCLREWEAAELQTLLDTLRKDFSAQSDLSSAQKALLEQPAALLIGGDISGIQKFIYTVTSKKAAQSLRGRSFFLQILTESVLRFALREFDIPYTNVIYSGGGHFFLLAPLDAEERIPALQEKISRALFKHFGTSLYLSLGYAKIPFRGFKKGCFPVYWNEMHRNLGLKKNRRYIEFGAEMRAMIFVPAAHGGNQEDVCSVCGLEKPGTRKIEGDADGGRICPSCVSFADDFGKYLPQSAYLRLNIGEAEDRAPGGYENALAAFGIGIELFDQNGKPLGERPALISAKRSVVWEISDPEPGWKAPAGVLPTAYRRHYLANKIPKMTFDEIQNEITNGIPRLGALRMDVDNLGSLFQAGFGEGKDSDMTISRLSTLSFQLSLFFEGYLKKLCEAHENIYTVYTGGDDLFLIGPWQEMLLLAEEIRREFSAYACGNPALSISGGMAFIHGKYPLRQAAEDAGAAESIAKALDGKNAFTFLGEAWSWNAFADLRAKKDRLKRAITEKGGPSSLLQLLMRLDEQRAQNGGKVYGRWLWMGDYQFTRMKDQYKRNPDLQADFDAIHKEIQNNLYCNLHIWGKAARWAQLEIRMTGRKE